MAQKLLDIKSDSEALGMKQLVLFNPEKNKGVVIRLPADKIDFIKEDGQEISTGLGSLNVYTYEQFKSLANFDRAWTPDLLE